MPYDTDIRGDATRRAFINARLIDPSQGLDTTGGIVIADGRIVASGANVTRASLTNGIDVTDCKGNLLMPGLIDMRVFTGEPGNEYRETLETASHAAAAGGVTTMVVMPNTEPAIDEPAIVDFIKRRARDTAIVRVAPMAAITRGLAGEAMAEIGLLRNAGAVAITDGNRAVAKHRLRTGCRDDEITVAVGEGIPEVPQLPGLSFGDDFQVGYRRVQYGIPVNQSLAAVDEPLLVQANEDFLHCLAQARVHGEALAGPVQ